MPRLKEVASISEMGTSRQFQWTPQQASSHSFEMQEGIMAVWTNDERTQPTAELPGTPLNFFTDMHRQVSTCNTTGCMAA